jgi:hypothetical protein
MRDVILVSFSSFAVPASNGYNSHKLIRFYGVSQQLKKVSCSCCRWKQTKSSHALPAHCEH